MEHQASENKQKTANNQSEDRYNADVTSAKTQWKVLRMTLIRGLRDYSVAYRRAWLTSSK